MTKNRKYWKSHAKQALKNQWRYAIGGMVAVQGISIIGSMLASNLFPGDSRVSLALSEMFLFIYTVVTLIFTTGYCYMLLNMARGKEARFADFVAMFHRGTNGILGAGLAVSLIQTLVSLPFYYMLYMADMGNTVEEQMVWMNTCIGYFLVSMVLSVVFTLPFAVVFQVLADEPTLGGIAALKKSMELMRGNIWKYLLLQISFLPLLLLSMFIFGIGLLWVIPYMQMTETIFYMDAAGEFDQPEPFSENHSGAAADARNQSTDNDGNNDYNAEA